MWGHVTSFPVTRLPPPASYSLVGIKCTKDLSFRISTATSRWLPVKWRHFQVTSGHKSLRDVIFCHVTDFCELQHCKKSNASKSSYRPSPAPSRRLPVKWLHFRVPSGYMRSRDVISCHVTASFCELQPCKTSKASKNSSFRHSTVTSRWLPVKWRHLRVTFGHMRSRNFFPVTWLTTPASYHLVGRQTHTKLEFSVFFSHFQETFGQMMSLPGHFWSRHIISCHVTDSCKLTAL